MIIPNYYDIVLLPLKEVAEVAIATSRRVAKEFPSNLALGKRSYKPHISLYHVAVAKKNLPSMIYRLREVVLRQKRIGSLMVAPYPNKPHFSVSRPDWLVALHVNILSAINPLRDTTFPNTWNNPLFRSTAERKRNIKKYGSPIVGRKLFDPHITLTNFQTPLYIPQAISLVPKKRFSFTPTAVVICAIGEHHSCQKTIATIPFIV